MKLLLKYPFHVIKEKKPYTAEVILETGVKVNIDRAVVDAVSGEMVVDVPDETCERVIASFESKGIMVTKLLQPILLDEDRCISCGACISLCPIKVFSFDDEWKLKIEEKKCIQCKICIPACPFGALRLFR
ncbi:MAG: 4Fe-4S binding protein [Candidatus Syntropharchaeia archaeon]